MSEEIKEIKQFKEQQNQQETAPKLTLPEDPVVFAHDFFGFDVKTYQAELLQDRSKRIVVCWSRQAGKTTCIALRAIWFACAYPKTLTLIVAPTLRQSMIMSDRVLDFLGGLSQERRSVLIEKLQRTTMRFRNGSRIIALPNSPQMLRGYTAHQVICDESAFFKDDQLVFYNVLYPMLSTTDGALIASSTPWSKDSVFYRMCQSKDFSKHAITCEDVVKSGLVKQSFIDEMRSQLPFERFQREFMAEFVEDVDAWLTQSLIVQCIDSHLVPYDFQLTPQGEFYVGVDFGKEQDFSVVLVFEKQGSVLRVVHVHRFPLHTEYASVIGYMKSLQDRWRTVRAVYADVTGVGNYIVEDMVRSGIQGVTGVTFTVQSKEEMATILREKMRGGEVKIPYVPARKLEDIDLTAELNIEKYELMKTGHLRFSHPEGGHDDVFWSCALSCFAAVQSPLPGRGAVMLPH
ncbi:MAG: terminase family protein [Candidatus Bathyarchaeia archaeon]